MACFVNKNSNFTASLKVKHLQQSFQRFCQTGLTLNLINSWNVEFSGNFWIMQAIIYKCLSIFITALLRLWTWKNFLRIFFNSRLFMEVCNKDILKIGESNCINRYLSKSSLNQSLTSNKLYARYNFVFVLLLTNLLLKAVTVKLQWSEILVFAFLKNSFLFVKIKSMELGLI